jgi:hypothetical protein
MPDLSSAAAITFADQLRLARYSALGDAEEFDEIIHTVERLGSYLTKEKFGDRGKDGDLGKYRDALANLASRSGLAYVADHEQLLTPFDRLYELVRMARNDAMHQGAFARHLTVHAIELAIILEDALTQLRNPTVGDFMVRSPVCAELWQPIGFIRQQMLANSYSYLPVLKDRQWYLISDVAIAVYLGAEREGPERKRRLASTLDKAFSDVGVTQIEPKPDSTSLADALEALRHVPALLIYRASDKDNLAGILTAFDLL